MIITTTRTIDAPIERVWALQLDHEHWPQHLPNFRRVVPVDRAGAFGVGSAADITQPALGTVRWTVDELDEQQDRCSFAWSGRANGITYTGRHLVEQRPDGRTQLTLSIVMEGGLAKVVGPLARRTVQRSIDAEAVAFDEWARSAADA